MFQIGAWVYINPLAHFFHLIILCILRILLIHQLGLAPFNFISLVLTWKLCLLGSATLIKCAEQFKSLKWNWIFDFWNDVFLYLIWIMSASLELVLMYWYVQRRGGSKEKGNEAMHAIRGPCAKLKLISQVSYRMHQLLVMHGMLEWHLNGLNFIYPSSCLSCSFYLGLF